jgi:hypothetical protein
MGHVACMEEMTNMYKILVRRLQGKRPLGRQGIDRSVILK